MPSFAPPGFLAPFSVKSGFAHIFFHWPENMLWKDLRMCQITKKWKCGKEKRKPGFFLRICTRFGRALKTSPRWGKSKVFFSFCDLFFSLQPANLTLQNSPHEWFCRRRFMYCCGQEFPGGDCKNEFVCCLFCLFFEPVASFLDCLVFVVGCETVAWGHRWWFSAHWSEIQVLGVHENGIGEGQKKPAFYSAQ